MSKIIKIKGIVTIRQLDKILIKESVNHFVDAGLKGLISTIIGKGCYNTYKNTDIWNLWEKDWQMYLGQDTAIPTAHDMTELQTPIGSAPGTPPDTVNITVKDGGAGGDADGVYHAKYIASWNIGTLPAVTLGEAALYLRAPTKTEFGWKIEEAYGETYTPDLVMISRLSSADVDFSSFVIDDTKPLTAEWTIELSFA